jgi:trans-2,3-dihydro-3-hydroxyanthranilate isomerase
VSNQKRRLPFVQVDVFTSMPLEGNQLAVFPDARGLSDTEMQALAREMNLSETTFIFPRDIIAEREHGVRVRIFTVTEELPFAGHPTLGTAMVLHGETAAEEVALDLNVGRIPVRFSSRGGLPFGIMTQRDPEFGQIHAREDVARAAGLKSEQMAPTWSAMNEYLSRTDAKFFYFVSREAVNPEAKLQARMIFYNGEDPATGSAAGPCVAWAVKYGVIASAREALIEQGVEMKRRSRIFVSASVRGDKIVNVCVGGHAVEVVRGEIVF